MPGLGSLASGLRPASSVKRGEVYIVRATDDGQVDPKGTRKFQYFPASLQETKGVTYQSREVPGASLPLYQWTGGGERQISFTAMFTTDIDHLVEASIAPSNVPGLSTTGLSDGDPIGAFGGANTERMNERLKAAGAASRNPFIPGALLWLRQFMLPRYSEALSSVSTPITFAPRKLWLVVPNSGLGAYGGTGGYSGAGFFCHMTQCDITINAMFPSGNIRSAEVSLAFHENAQAGAEVRFPGWSSSYDDQVEQWYNLYPSKKNT